MSTEPSSARSSARRLIAGSSAPSDAPEHAAVGAYEAVGHVVRALTRTLGPTGAVALIERALVDVRETHPLVNEIQFVPGAEDGLSGVTASVEAHGGPPVVAALESLLETLLELLGRLIGDDLVARLVELGPPNATQDDEEAP